MWEEGRIAKNNTVERGFLATLPDQDTTIANGKLYLQHGAPYRLVLEDGQVFNQGVWDERKMAWRVSQLINMYASTDKVVSVQPWELTPHKQKELGEVFDIHDCFLSKHNPNNKSAPKWRHPYRRGDA